MASGVALAVEVQVEVQVQVQVQAEAEVEAAAGTMELEEAVQARWAVQEEASAGQAQERAKQSSSRATARCGTGGWPEMGKGCGRWRALGALPSLLAREPEARTEHNVQVEVAH